MRRGENLKHLRKFFKIIIFVISVGLPVVEWYFLVNKVSFLVSINSLFFHYHELWTCWLRKINLMPSILFRFPNTMHVKLSAYTFATTHAPHVERCPLEVRSLRSSDWNWMTSSLRRQNCEWVRGGSSFGAPLRTRGSNIINDSYSKSVGKIQGLLHWVPLFY